MCPYAHPIRCAGRTYVWHSGKTMCRIFSGMDKRPSLRPATSCCFAPMSRSLREERRSDPASYNCAVNHQNRISTRTDDRKGDRWFNLLLRADLLRHQAEREASSGNHWTLHLVSWGRRCIINRRTPTSRSTVECSIVRRRTVSASPTVRGWWLGEWPVSGSSLLKSYIRACSAA